MIAYVLIAQLKPFNLATILPLSCIASYPLPRPAALAELDGLLLPLAVLNSLQNSLLRHFLVLNSRLCQRETKNRTASKPASKRPASKRQQRCPTTVAPILASDGQVLRSRTPATHSSSVEQPAPCNLERRLPNMTGKTEPNRWGTFFERRFMQWGHICLRLWPAVLGRDDSLLQDGDAVYVVDHIQFDLPGPIQKIDYFHGLC